MEAKEHGIMCCECEFRVTLCPCFVDCQCAQPSDGEACPPMQEVERLRDEILRTEALKDSAFNQLDDALSEVKRLRKEVELFKRGEDLALQTCELLHDQIDQWQAAAEMALTSCERRDRCDAIKKQFDLE